MKTKAFRGETEGVNKFDSIQPEGQCWSVQKSYAEMYGEVRAAELTIFNALDLTLTPETATKDRVRKILKFIADDAKEHEWNGDRTFAEYFEMCEFGDDWHASQITDAFSRHIFEAGFDCIIFEEAGFGGEKTFLVAPNAKINEVHNA